MKTLLEYTDKQLTSNVGLLHGGQLLKNKEFRDAIRNVSTIKKKSGVISDVDIICSMIALYMLGKTEYEDIEAFRYDSFFKTVTGIKQVPSSEILRQRIERLPEEITPVLREFNASIIAGGFEERKASRVKDIPYEETILIDGVPYVMIDSDVTVLDNSNTKKEGVSWTYKKCDGYAPMISYAGKSGYMLNSELREGSMHSNCEGTERYIEETIDLARQITDENLLMVFDSGNDDQKLLVQLEAESVFYLVKRNPRQEAVSDWVEMAKQQCSFKRTGRDGSNVYYGRVSRNLMNDPVNPIVHIVIVAREKLQDQKGQLLIQPELSVDTYWTNLKCSEADVESVYHRHGTSEQYHAELKSDLGVERLPSGKFHPNMLHMLFSMIGFNALRRIGSAILLKGKLPGKRGNRLRIRTVLQNVMYMAGLVLSHSGMMIIKIFTGHPWAEAVHDYS